MISIQSPQQLGEALRQARKQLNLTQPQLATADAVVYATARAAEAVGPLRPHC